MGALLLERRALRDTEAVLLVGDDEAEPREVNVILDQRVRADDNVDLVARDGLVHLAPLSWRQVAREVADADAERCELRREILIVLGGEDLGRRHHRALPAACDRLDEREHGDDRLAGADVSLHEPPHRHGPLHVAADLLPRLLLVVRQREGQAREDSLHELAIGLVTDAEPRLLGLLLDEQQSALDEVELREGQTVARPLELLPVLREVHGAQGLASAHELVLSEDARRNELRQLVSGLQRLLDERAEELLVQPFRRRIDGQDAAEPGCLLPLFEDLEVAQLAHRELAAAAVGVGGLAADEDAPPDLELVLEVLLVEPGDLQEARAVIEVGRQDRQAAPPRLLLQVDDGTRDRRDRARPQVSDARQRALVLIRARKVRQDIVDPRDAKPRELRLLLRPDALEVLDRIRDLHGENRILSYFY